MRIPGYELTQEFLKNDRFLIYRALRESDRTPVLLKVASRALPGDAADALRLECDLISELSLPGVPAVYEYSRREDRAYLVLEDRGLIPLSAALAAGRLDLESFFNTGLSVCAILGELHRRDIIHGSVNPDSIWVSPATAEVQLADFSRAVRSSGEAQDGIRPGGALAYASPEQTGRMNRAVDYRTDFYSLGATLYHVLTGSPPFQTDDRLELIHSHLAKLPPPPAKVLPDLPAPVSQIILQLLAKTAEDRYQSAIGLKHDLEACRREWAATRSIAPFTLGRRDIPDRFLIPQKLYGRDGEVNQLLAAFDRSAKGATAMMLVRGYAGIGKTSLIQELYKPIVRQRGYFISGKFDQVVRNTPYGGLIQAFRALVRQLITESEDRLFAWRKRLSEALGASGGVLAEVIPEIELVLGKQPSPPSLDPAEAQNRFRYVLQNFVGALAASEHPLILFLDDLQWADSATLGLLQPLLTSPDIRYLFLIGAYRDNEVSEAHPLLRTLSTLETTGARLHQIDLGPLRLPELTLLLEDALHREQPDVGPLARVILQKTDGNPFFVLQFLKTLEEEALIRFDDTEGCWRFSMDAIAAAAITDNVIDLMTRKIRRLPASAQQVLLAAACIGSEFDAVTLATVSQQSLAETETALRGVLREGLIAVSGGEAHAYRFLHDRVQQAAYAMLAEDRKQELHLMAGRLLLARMQASAAEEKLFDLVQHLNRGSSLIRDMAERIELARLNLSASRKAKASAAFQPALTYLRAGLDLLTEDCWRSEYELMWNLQIETSECEHLSGRFSEAEARFSRLLQHARTDLDRAQVHSLRVVQNETLASYPLAVQCGSQGLALFGVSFPETPEEKQAAVEAELSHIEALLAGRPIDALVDIPPMAHPDKRVVMKLLTALWAPSYLAGDQLLTRLISATMVRLSLAHGNAEESAYGYVTHAITVGPVRGDYKAAYAWGDLALKVNERFEDAKRRAKVHQQFNAHVALWRRPFESCIHHAREARRCGLETGDFTYAGYGALTESWAALLTLRDLDRFVADCASSVALLERINMTGLVPIQKVILNWGRALQGRTSGRLSLSDENFDEQAYLDAHGTHPFSTFFYYALKLALCVIFEADAMASDLAPQARAVAQHLSGTVWPVFLDLLYGLTLAARHAEAAEAQQLTFDAELERIQPSLALLAENCPENFACWSLLLAAEIDRIKGRDSGAMASYEQAIRYARQTGNPLNEALAADFYGRFWNRRDNEAIAALYFGEAARVYGQLRAVAKVRDLEERYAVARPGGNETVALDIETVTKAAHAIGSELDLEDLLRRLVQIALENAGAQRCLLLREEDGDLVVDAEAKLDPPEVRVLQSARGCERPDLAWAVVRYVQNTGQSVVVGDALRDDRFSDSPYIQAARARSLLCASAVHQGKLAGILYLENNLAADAFTPDRIRIVQILSSQAAISLENARLYAEMKEEVARRRAAENELRGALDELQALKKRLEVENVYLREEIRKEHNFEEIVGNSAALLEVLTKVERVAPTDSAVLICGETGTGKELVARAVHSRSSRRERPLVKVNCGAISAGLVESELFGHMKGAFTGALERRVGRFEIADGGTLFLDEVSELPLETQVKLLRVLQEGEFEPVGSSRTLRVDVRIISATNRDLAEAVRAGRFRSDLFYRLNVFPLNVPPLRERRADIPPLVTFFLSRFSKKFGKKIESVSRESMDLLISYAWPGNIRELQNLLERAVVLCQGSVVSLEREVLPRAAASPPLAAAASASVGETDSPTALEDVERRHILAVLDNAGWVIEGTKGAAKALDLHPNTLRSRMKKLGIQRSTHGRS